MPIAKICLLLFIVVFLLPLAASALRYLATGAGGDWQSADRSSAGLLPPPARNPGALVRVFAARTVRWRGIFAVHCWVVVKPAQASDYTRYDYTAWGEPIRVNGFTPDGRWFGRVPELVFAADGAAAASMIPRIEAAVASYALRNLGDYRAWPGPNSNTFVAALFDAVPEARLLLPPTAIGRDYPYDGRWLRLTPSGARLTLGGYAGIWFDWKEGFELNILAAVAGVDFRNPAIELPGLGRIALWRRPAPGSRDEPNLAGKALSAELRP